MIARHSKKKIKELRKSDLADKIIMELQAERLKNERINQARRHRLLGEVVSNLMQLKVVDSNTIERGLDFYLISTVDRDLFSLPPRNNPQI
ncbi:hypothetical protein [Chamaesiphon minutus]|uniref:Uncharacterized protein n=1 Tax=Chamaesiphon minutus (strain ATCC 27169 / PCC 6605) TaxID=1173020 RepID=K9UQ86_CHAP6|nr:hypothetical protein [Chamaesiphon minutus]AFY97232.1 hypothetical protein Cha6605_6413 [Chamaesiphon minutus PCC 6605]